LARDSRGRFLPKGMVLYRNAKGRESVVPAAEAERRRKIGTFARARTREDGGTFDVRRYRVEVAGWTTKSREGSKDERKPGWEFRYGGVFVVESASDDEDYLRELLNEMHPARRFWDVVEIEPL